MSFIDKVLILFLVIGIAWAVLPEQEDPNYFVLAQSQGIVSEHCNAINGNNVEVIFDWKRYPTETKYGGIMVAGRCPSIKFQSSINMTQGTKAQFRATIKQDALDYIINNNITFQMYKWPKGQHLDGGGNFTLP